jgi:hypothetical protein
MAAIAEPQNLSLNVHCLGPTPRPLWPTASSFSLTAAAGTQVPKLGTFTSAEDAVSNGVVSMTSNEEQMNGGWLVHSRLK